MKDINYPNMSEVDYKVKFAKQYFGKGCCEFDVLKEVDILLKVKKDNYVLYTRPLP